MLTRGLLLYFPWKADLGKITYKACLVEAKTLINHDLWSEVSGQKIPKKAIEGN